MYVRSRDSCTSSSYIKTHYLLLHVIQLLFVAVSLASCLSSDHGLKVLVAVPFSCMTSALQKFVFIKKKRGKLPC